MKAIFKSNNGARKKRMKYIWIIYDDDSNAITAPTWEAAIYGWIDKWRVTGDATLVFDEALNEWRSLKDMCGYDWRSVLIARGYRDFNDLLDPQFYACQVPYYEK